MEVSSVPWVFQGLSGCKKTKKALKRSKKGLKKGPQKLALPKWTSPYRVPSTGTEPVPACLVISYPDLSCVINTITSCQSVVSITPPAEAAPHTLCLLGPLVEEHRDHRHQDCHRDPSFQSGRDTVCVHTHVKLKKLRPHSGQWLKNPATWSHYIC